MEIQFTTQVFKEGKTFVAHTTELDISSCGETEKKALHNLNEAVTLLLEEADKLGTLDQILEQSGFFKARTPYRYS
jgi:predicted RNase H-like HicB family nuclease